MQVKLLCRDVSAPERAIVLTQFPADIGRGEDVAVRIDDRWLSRRHCRLELDGGVLTVRDLGSRHGTFVNGQSVSHCQLLPGDNLSIGLSHFVAQYDASLATARSQTAASQALPVLA